MYSTQQHRHSTQRYSLSKQRSRNRIQPNSTRVRKDVDKKGKRYLCGGGGGLLGGVVRHEASARFRLERLDVTVVEQRRRVLSAVAQHRVAQLRLRLDVIGLDTACKHSLIVRSFMTTGISTYFLLILKLPY